MGLMRRLIPFALAALTASSVAAQGYTPYHQLRQENPAIDETVALLSSSDIHGTLNRISALYNRKPIRDLGTNVLEIDTPSSYRRGMLAALDDLKADLQAADADLAADTTLTDQERLAAKWVLLQVVNLVFADRQRDLSVPASGIQCGASEPTIDCPYSLGERTDILDSFQTFFFDAGTPTLLRDWMEEIIDDALLWDSGDFTFSLTNVDASRFTHQVELLASAAISSPSSLGGVNLIVHGEPSIDF